MKSEIRNFTDGAVEIEVKTDEGEPIAILRVSACKGFGANHAEHEVELLERELWNHGPRPQPNLGVVWKSEDPHVVCIPPNDDQRAALAETT